MADGEKEAVKKKTFFDRTRKLVLAGVVTTGILLGGIGLGNAARFEQVREPPISQQSYYKINYNEGWNALMKGNELLVKGGNSKGYIDKAIKYFEKEKKENKDLEGWDKLALHYILDYCYYTKACDGKTSKEADFYLKKAIELATIDYEQFKGSKNNNEIVFLDLIVLSYKHIGYTFFTDGGGREDIKLPINLDYLKIAKENFQKALNFYNQYEEELTKADSSYPEDFKNVEKYIKRINQLLRIEEKAEAKKF